MKLPLWLKSILGLKSFRAALVLLIICIIVGFLVKDFPWREIYAGMVAGLIILFFQAFLDYDNLILNLIIKKSAMKNVLSDRNKKQYYENILTQAEEEVLIMGVTACRFFRDFGSSGNKLDTSRVIDRLLSRGVKFRILLIDKNSDNARTAKRLMKKYKNHGEIFKVRYFKKTEYIPQSMFVVDKECILGPIFTDISSKDTGAIHFYDKDSVYAKQYMAYFEKVWENSKAGRRKKRE